MHFATRRAFNPAALFSDSRSRKTALAAGARKIAVGAGRRAEKTAASKLPCKINGRSLLRARKWRQTSTWYCGTTGFTKRRAKIRSNPATRRWPFLARANSDWSGVRQARRAAQRGKKVSRSPRGSSIRARSALSGGSCRSLQGDERIRGQTDVSHEIKLLARDRAASRSWGTPVELILWKIEISTINYEFENL